MLLKTTNKLNKIVSILLAVTIILSVCSLSVFALTDAEKQEYEDKIADIKDHFSKFDKVYIFSDIEYLDELRYCPNVVVVDNHDFLEDIKGKVIYHYSGY